jgi:hypothetical protein
LGLSDEETDLRGVGQFFQIAGVSVAVMAATAVAGTSWALAAAHTSQRVDHPVFKRIAGSGLLSGSGYVAVYGSMPGQVRLINTSTGQWVTTEQPGCTPDAVGGYWLAMTCGTGYSKTDRLYDIPLNRTVPFTGPCATGSCDGIAAVGMQWIALTPPCSQPGKCPSTFQFENLKTRVTRRDPTNATTVADLDSRRLAAPVCRPITVPRDNQSIEDGTYPGWGSVTRQGDYRIEAGGAGVFLQRCGTRARTFLTFTPGWGGCAARACAPTSNTRMVVWQSAAGRLSAVFLKGLHRFQITVPATVDPYTQQLKYVRADPYKLALAANTLYLQTPSGTVWAARSPAR